MSEMAVVARIILKSKGVATNNEITERICMHLNMRTVDVMIIGLRLRRLVQRNKRPRLIVVPKPRKKGVVNLVNKELTVAVGRVTGLQNVLARVGLRHHWTDHSICTITNILLSVSLSRTFFCTLGKCVGRRLKRLRYSCCVFYSLFLSFCGGFCGLLCRSCSSWFCLLCSGWLTGKHYFDDFDFRNEHKICFDFSSEKWWYHPRVVGQNKARGTHPEG